VLSAVMLNEVMLSAVRLCVVAPPIIHNVFVTLRLNIFLIIGNLQSSQQQLLCFFVKL
jgi:hypothetical protein